MTSATPEPNERTARRANTYLLLALAALFWSGNHIVGRAIGGHVPPVGVSDWRLLTCALVAGLVTFFFHPGVARIGRFVRVLDAAGLAVFAIGGSLTALVLSHWYLVTPRISERPLLLATRVLIAALVIQVLLFATWLVVALDGGLPFAALTGPNALLVWLRLIVGLLFPLALTVMAYRTALTRSMESATGLLYIELAVVLASTIVAAALLMAEGQLV